MAPLGPAKKLSALGDTPRPQVRKGYMTAFGYSCGMRSVGRAAAMAAYINRSGRYASRRKTSPEELVGIGSGNMPSWAATNSVRFWAAADRHERANGRAANTRILTLPRGLDTAQQERAALRIAVHLCGTRHPYQWAIHKAVAADGGEQPHVHLMWSPREADGIERGSELFFRRYNSAHPERGGARKTTTSGVARAERAAAMYAEREVWAAICNDALEAAGVVQRVDARTNAARGISRPPELKLRSDQRADKAVLAELHATRRAWARADAAEARACTHERVAAARTPREMPADRMAPLARQLRTEAVKGAQEQHTLLMAVAAAAAQAEAARIAQERQAREMADMRLEARVRALKRVAAARAPREMPADRMAPLARQLRTEAVKGAQEQHTLLMAVAAAAAQAEAARIAQERQAREMADMRLDDDRRTTTVHERTERHAAPTARSNDHVSQAGRRLGTGQGHVGGATPSRPVHEPVQPAAQQAQEAGRKNGEGSIGRETVEAWLREPGVIHVDALGRARFTAQEAVWNGTRSSADPGLHGLGKDFDGIGLTWKAGLASGGWGTFQICFADLVTALGRLTRVAAERWIERLRRSTAQSDASLPIARRARQESYAEFQQRTGIGARPAGQPKKNPGDDEGVTPQRGEQRKPDRAQLVDDPETEFASRRPPTGDIVEPDMPPNANRQATQPGKAKVTGPKVIPPSKPQPPKSTGKTTSGWER